MWHDKQYCSFIKKNFLEVDNNFVTDASSILTMSLFDNSPDSTKDSSSFFSACESVSKHDLVHKMHSNISKRIFCLSSWNVFFVNQAIET